MMAKRLTMVLLCCGLFACQSSESGDSFVAKVNGEGIAKQDYDKMVERNLARYRGHAKQLPPGIEDRIRESVLRRMIDDKIIAQKAAEVGIEVSDDEVNTKFDEHKNRFRTEQAFKDYLTRSNNTEDHMKADLKRNMLRDRVVERLSGPVEVAADEVKTYYDSNKVRFKEKEQVRASRILLRLAHDASSVQKKEALAKAKEVRKKALRGSDFAALAKEHSKGPEAARGGDLGWFSRGRFPAEFDAAVFATKVGQVSDVVETRLGYEIVHVAEKKDERQRPLDEVRLNIERSLAARKRNKKRREVLSQLKTEAKVEPMISFNSAGTPGQKNSGIAAKALEKKSDDKDAAATAAADGEAEADE